MKHGIDHSVEAVKKRISRSDLLLIGFLLLAGAGSLLFVSRTRNSRGSEVLITVDGTAYGSYELSKEQTVPIKIHGIVTNTLQISEEKAQMIQADCPDQLCIHQGAVSSQGETIVCLPNKIVVEVRGGKAAETDAVAR